MKLAAMMIGFVTTGCTNGKSVPMTTPDPRAEVAITFDRLDGDLDPGDPMPRGTELLNGYSVIKARAIEALSTRKKILDPFEAEIVDHDGGEPAGGWLDVRCLKGDL